MATCSGTPCHPGVNPVLDNGSRRAASPAVCRPLRLRNALLATLAMLGLLLHTAAPVWAAEDANDDIAIPAGLGVGATPAAVIACRQEPGESDATLDFPLARSVWEVAFARFLPAIEAVRHAQDAPAVNLAPQEEALALEGYLLAHPVSKMTFEDGELVINPLPDSSPVPLAQAEVWAGWLGMGFSGTVEYTCQFYVPKEWTGDPVRLEVGNIEHAASVRIDDKPLGDLILPPWQLVLEPLEFGAHTITIEVTSSPANVAAVTFGPEAKKDPEQVAWYKKALDACGGGLKGPVLLRRMEIPAVE